MYQGGLLPVCANATCIVTADALEETEIEESCASLYMTWLSALTGAICHVFAGGSRDRKRAISQTRQCAVHAGEYDQDPQSADWFCHPDSLIVHMMHCDELDGNCNAGVFCKTARIVLGHLYHCEDPGCSLCQQWADWKCHQSGMEGMPVVGLVCVDSAMSIMHASLPGYLKTRTKAHTAEVPVSGLRRKTEDGKLKFPLEEGDDATEYAKGIDGFHAKGHTRDTCRAMDTGKVTQLLRRRDIKKGQTGEQLHSVLKDCLSFLNVMSFFNHYFGMQMALALYNEDFREQYYRWMCKETCRCGMKDEEDEVWELKCACNGAYVRLDPFLRFCDVRSLAPPARSRPPTVSLAATSVADVEIPIVGTEVNEPPTVNLTLDNEAMDIVRSLTQSNNEDGTAPAPRAANELPLPVCSVSCQSQIQPCAMR
jgi:hypothetical protein